jgi:hypothetical protein
MSLENQKNQKTQQPHLQQTRWHQEENGHLLQEALQQARPALQEIEMIKVVFLRF